MCSNKLMSLTLRMYLRIVMIIYLLSDVFQMLLTRKEFWYLLHSKTRVSVWIERNVFYSFIAHLHTSLTFRQLCRFIMLRSDSTFTTFALSPKLTHKNIMIKMMQKNINNLLYAKRPWLHKHRTWSMHMYTTTKSTLQSHNKSP